MTGGRRVVCFDPRDFGLERGHALHQLVLRIAVERLAGQPARGVTADPGEIVLHDSKIEFGPLAVNGGDH